MRRIDLSPLFRHSVGFEGLDELVDAMLRQSENASAYPPYDIARIHEDHYRVTLAVAGFTADDLEVVTTARELAVRGKAQAQDDSVEYLHRGIARRAFEHRFQLAEGVEVTGAHLANGLLAIDLVRTPPATSEPARVRIDTPRRS